MELITSSQNQLIKDIKALKDRKHREAKGLYYIEGRRIVEEALNEGAGVARLVVSESFGSRENNNDLIKQAAEQGVNIAAVADRLFSEICDTETPQGVMAVVKMQKHALDSMLSGHKCSFLMVLDGLQDPGNMGTVIRTADAAGVDGIVLTKGCVDLYNPKVLRSTMGSIFHVPVCFEDDAADAVMKIKAGGFSVLASHLSGSVNYFEQDLEGPVAIVVGNEARGISDAAAQAADMLVKIPMPGRAESLNASVAAALLMYEVVRKRK